MKTATFPSVRGDPELRQAAEDSLNEGASIDGEYVSSDAVLGRLEQILAKAKAQK